MDELVKAALAKWPNVPHCRGWLGLDARGDWYMRDDRVQAAGPFPVSRGSRIEHAKLKAFIERNYEPDSQGQWFFQNGPQRVYVELEATPWVWRVHFDAQCEAGLSVCSHTGRSAVCRAVWLDESGRVFLDTDIGFGLVHTQDVAGVAESVEAGLCAPQEAEACTLPERFGYVPSPALSVR